jgi:ribosomal protein S18 acetylase RimI-like enzyme
MTDVKPRIRLYQPSDRAAIRRLCCDTADGGRPVGRFFDDRDVFADLWTRYYTDVEPEHAWVAEAPEGVMGYLTACWNDARFDSLQRRRVLPVAFFKCVLHGTLLRAKTLRLLWNNRFLWTARDEEISYQRYPVHFHINLDASFRGRGAGASLVEHACRQIKEAGLPGLRAVTRADNRAARAFFEKQGFQQIASGRTFVLPGQTSDQKIVYGRLL